MDDKEMQPDYQIIPSRIALWGVAGSGKTWLINALGRSLVNFHSTDPDFIFELREFSGEKFEPIVMPFKPPKYQPTRELIDFMWLFQRRPKQSTYAHQISTHTHVLHIHDIDGNDAVRLAKNVRENYSNIHMLLLMLDPSSLGNHSAKLQAKSIWNSNEIRTTTDAFEKEYIYPTIMTHELYLYSVKQLLDYVSESNATRPFVAVCLTKSDLWNKDIDPESAIRIWFGQQMVDMLGQYSKGFTMKMFTMTSCGYLDGDTNKPNYNKRSGELLDIKQWTPRGVLDPLFWFFDNVERQKLIHAKDFFERFAGRNRIKKYITYPAANDILI